MVHLHCILRGASRHTGVGLRVVLHLLHRCDAVLVNQMDRWRRRIVWVSEDRENELPTRDASTVVNLSKDEIEVLGLQIVIIW